MKVVCVFVVPVLAGCASQESAGISAVYDDYQANRLAYYKSACLPDKDLNKIFGTMSARNDAINDLVLLIDGHYYKTEEDIYSHKAAADFAGDVAVTGLSTASTLVGGTGLKTTLSAIVTAISGTKVSFNSDFLQNQSIIAIITQMRKQRAEKILDIRKSMTLSIDQYPLSQALDDLMEYYNDGTPVAALQGMTEDAAAAKKTADQGMQDFKGTYGADINSIALRNYWKPEGVINAANTKALKSFLSTEKINVSIESFLGAAQYADERKKAVTQLIK